MFYGLFTNEEDVCKEFQIDSVDGVILFAVYEYEDYSGSAEVVFVRDGRFFHVSGSHCSCYGLEGQWEPEEMPVEALKHVILQGYGLLRDLAGPLANTLEYIETLNLEGASPESVRVAAKLAFG